MKVAVIGGRDFTNYELLDNTLKVYSDKITTIVSGGAKGADFLAEYWAEKNNKGTLIFLPNWDLYGKKAGFVRNELIVINSDAIIAFWDRKSRGTKSSIDIAKKLNKPTMIVYY